MESVVAEHGIRLGNVFNHYTKAVKSPSDLAMLGNGSLEFMMDARIDSAESERKMLTNAMHFSVSLAILEMFPAEVSMPDGIESRM